MATTTADLAHAVARMQVGRACKKCKARMPRYRGRYPHHCPNCGSPFNWKVAQPTMKESQEWTMFDLTFDKAGYVESMRQKFNRQGYRENVDWRYQNNILSLRNGLILDDGLIDWLMQVGRAALVDHNPREIFKGHTMSESFGDVLLGVRSRHERMSRGQMTPPRRMMETFASVLGHITEAYVRTYQYPPETWPLLTVRVEINPDDAHEEVLGHGTLTIVKGKAKLDSDAKGQDYVVKGGKKADDSKTATWNDENFSSKHLTILDDEINDMLKTFDKTKDDFQPDEIAWATVLAKVVRPVVSKFTGDLENVAFSEFRVKWSSENESNAAEVAMMKSLKDLKMRSGG